MSHVFISHASEDKEAFVRPLAEALRKRSIDVWYDDGLSHEWWALGKERIITCEESIECRRVVVVLPPNSSVKRC